MTLSAKIKGFIDFLAISGCETHFKSELRRNQLRYALPCKMQMLQIVTLRGDYQHQIAHLFIVSLTESTM